MPKHEFFDTVLLFPKRHPFWIAGTIAGLVLAAALIGGAAEVLNLRNEVTVQRTQVTRLQTGDPCVQLAQANGSNRERVERLTRRCIVFLDGIGPLVSTKLACAIVEKGGYRCKALPLNSKPTPSSPQSGSSKGVVDSNGHAPSSQPGPPSHGGHHGGSKGAHHAHHTPASQPSPAPAPVAPAPELPPAPGNSGTTPGGEHGVKACVEVVVSACVKAETPEPPPIP